MARNFATHLNTVDLRYHEKVREVLAPFRGEPAQSWEVEGHLPRAVFRRLGEAGIFRQRWAEDATAGLPELVVLATETADVSSGLALGVMGHTEVFIGSLQWLADTAAQHALLEAALDGTAVGCFAATEPHGGSSLAGARTLASRRGEGWHLRGCKRYISNVGTATHALVVARIDGRDEPNDLSVFVVPVGAGGAEVAGFFTTAGSSACDVGELRIDVEVGPDALLGSPGLGLLYANRLLQFERLSICAQLLAGARTSLGLAMAHARRREVAGGPLVEKQVVRHRLANCQVELWAAEAMFDGVLRAMADDQPVSHESAAAKVFCTRTAERIADQCMQVFGARGYTTNYPLERIWRDVRLARIGGGPDEVLIDVVASGINRPERRYEEWLDRLEAADAPALMPTSSSLS